MTKKLTVAEAAREFGFSPSSIRYWMDFKNLKFTVESVKGAKDRKVIERKELESFIKKGLNR